MTCTRLLMRGLVRVLTAFGLALVATSAYPHEVRPAYLEMTETAPGVFDVLFKTPMVGEFRLSLHVEVSGSAKALTPVLSRTTESAMVQTWRLHAVDHLAGQTVRILGLENTISDALLRVQFAGGEEWTQRLTPATPMAQVPTTLGASGVAATYFSLGVEHILTGYDHLLFVLGLILITSGMRQLVQAVTAFTAAHSITLAAAVLGFVHVPQKPVEAIIALSIAFVAAEAIQRRAAKLSLTSTAPWLLAFGFGLLHGLGFAGALSETGLPARHIPTALLFFNLGVESGQLLFVGAVIALVALFRLSRLSVPRWARLAPPYVMGCVAMFWVVQRVSVF
jgi:hydrogenase/urease accessory protein HupE